MVEKTDQVIADQCHDDAGYSSAANQLTQTGYWVLAYGQDDTYWSEAMMILHGLDRPAGEMSLGDVLALYCDDDAAALDFAISAAFETGDDLGVVTQLDGAGRNRSIETLGRIVETERGNGLLLACRDVSERIGREKDIAWLSSRLDDFIEVSSDWLWEMGPDLRFTYMSPNVEDVTGVPAEFHIGKSRRELMAGTDIPLEMEMHLAWLEQHKPFRDFRFWREGPGGKQQFLSTSGRAFYDDDGNFAGYRGSGRDLTAAEEAREALIVSNRKLKLANKEKSDALASLQEANATLEQRARELEGAQAEIEFTALHDPLTGIANRRFLDIRMHECAEQCRTSGGWLGALHIDLDRFKQINDTLGHPAGDAVLRHVADVLSQSVPEDDFVARVGGDEFVVICTGHGGAQMLGSLAQRIIDEFSRPLEFEDRELWFGASVGIATQQGEDIVPDQLLRNADVALYRAKSNGRGCFEYFSDALQNEVVAYKAAADGILAALKREEFEPWFQPQICAQTMAISGMEALARWHVPNGEVRTPDRFLSIAEDLGVVASIDRMIMERAIAQVMAWRAAGLTCPRISVNVSARRLKDDNLIESIAEINFPEGLLVFELLESVYLDDVEDTITWNIDMLREMGIEIELDDFGSGHASLISLIRLAPDAIKIDRQLVSSMGVDQTRYNLVQSIIEIGQSIGVRVIAEGVETEQEMHELSRMGCDTLQGYHIARPMPARDIPQFIRSWEERHGLREMAAG